MYKKVLFVGGTFNNECGKQSSLINRLIDTIKKDKRIQNLTYYNGGHVSELKEILNSVIDKDIVFWMPNVSNDEVKIRDVKSINPKTILINSKRNDNGKYTFAELIQRSLSAKANLTIEFSKVEEKVFNMLVFDPLGCEYYNGPDIEKMCEKLLDRTFQLTEFTRKPTKRVYVDTPIQIPNEEEFFAFARNCSEIFHNLVRPAKATERFLGNMSFRCQNGFPSFRGNDGIIYVSKRNVDKSEITKESFVPCYLDVNKDVCYFGENKPSVDTPIQLRLYELFPHINFMLHAHCYINIPNQKQLFTFHPVPCGAIEEVSEIYEVLKEQKNDKKLYAVNLIGHGCLIMATDVSAFTELSKQKDSCFVSRPMPENITNELINETLLSEFKTDKVSVCKPITIEQLQKITSEFAYLSASLKKTFYCCNGLFNFCWQETVASGTDDFYNISNLYEEAFTKYPERILYLKPSKSTGKAHCIILLLRDKNEEKVDYTLTWYD